MVTIIASGNRDLLVLLHSGDTLFQAAFACLDTRTGENLSYIPDEYMQ